MPVTKATTSGIGTTTAQTSAEGEASCTATSSASSTTSAAATSSTTTSTTSAAVTTSTSSAAARAADGLSVALVGVAGVSGAHCVGVRPPTRGQRS